MELNVAPDVRHRARLVVYWRARRQASRRVGRNANRRGVSPRYVVAIDVRRNANLFTRILDALVDGFIGGRRS